jgi:hypothetical protein
MNRVLLTGVAAAGALALTVPLVATADHRPGHPPKPPKGTGNLTISAAPNPVLFGRSVTISGRLRGNDNGGKTIELQHDPYPFATEYNPKPTATTTTQADGDYSFTVRPEVRTNYRTVAKIEPEARSDNQTVGVKVRITRRVSDNTPRRGQVVTFTGTVTPAHDGRTVYIQRRRSTGSWRTVATTRLKDDGASRSVYRRGLRINRDGTYRVKINTHADHTGNKTRRVRLDVP